MFVFVSNYLFFLPIPTRAKSVMIMISNHVTVLHHKRQETHQETGMATRRAEAMSLEAARLKKKFQWRPYSETCSW